MLTMAIPDVDISAVRLSLVHSVLMYLPDDTDVYGSTGGESEG